MKRITNYLLISVCVFLMACGGGVGSGGGSGSKVGDKVAKTVTGTAAKGAVLPKGSVVELRSSVGYVDIETYVLDDNGEKTYDENGDPVTKVESVYKESVVLTGSIEDNNGTYAIDVTEVAKPFLLRVQDAGTGTWYYSIADGVSTKANINPYTDILIRMWYMDRACADNPANIDIDDVFTSGLLTVAADGSAISSTPINYTYDLTEAGTIYYGKPLALPDIDDIEQVRLILNYNIKQIYGVDMENVLTTNWTVGASYDALLDSTGFDRSYLDLVASNAYCYPTRITNCYVVCDTTAKTITIDFWTSYAGTHLYLNQESTWELTLASTDSNGLKHYTGTFSYTTKPSLVCSVTFDYISNAQYVCGFPVYFK